MSARIRTATEMGSKENDRVRLTVFSLDEKRGVEAYDPETGRFLRGYPNLTRSSLERLNAITNC